MSGLKNIDLHRKYFCNDCKGIFFASASAVLELIKCTTCSSSNFEKFLPHLHEHQIKK